MRSINRRNLLKGGILAAVSMLIPEISKGINVPSPGFKQIINAGIGGQNTVDLLQRIDQDCMRHQPDLTLLLVGTNDMNSVKHVPLDQYEKNLNALARKAMQHGGKLVMMTILPAYSPHLLTRHPATFYEPEGVEGRLRQINKVVKKVAAKRKAYLVDLEFLFLAIGEIGTDKDSLLQNLANSGKTDGIHPTANGYRFIAMTIYDHLIANKLAQGTIVCFGDSITKGDGSINGNNYPAYLNKLLTYKHD